MASNSLLTFALAFSTFSLVSAAAAAFSPTKSFFLDCGSATPTALNDGRTFVPDSTFLTSSSNSAPPLSASTPSPLYSTARAFTTPTSYHFPTDFHSTYILRLHFLPFSTPSRNLSQSLFSVSALDRFQLLSSFSPNSSTSTVKEFLLFVDADQFTLTFTPSPLAFVNAIELFTAPSELLNGVDQSIVSSPLETLFRVNVGGHSVTPANDTLWRTWVPDDDFLQNPFSLKNSCDPSAVVYGAGDPRHTKEIAPASVYDTARTMDMSMLSSVSTTPYDFNVTWRFPVIPGGRYFVRLHFCNFLFPSVDQFMFNVYVGGSARQQDFRPAALTDDTDAAACYLDFSADPDGSGNMNVSIGRSKNSIAENSNSNAMLNGVEIMKIGLASVDPSSPNKKRHTVSLIAILIPSIAGGLLFVGLAVAAALFARRKKPAAVIKPKPPPNSASWSPFQPEISSLSSKSTDRTTNLDLLIPFDEIKFATNNFDETLVIGAGGFGKVYKGVLRDGTTVALKRATRGSKQGFPEFQAEVEVLSRIRHRHLVSLIGYCDDQSEMVLVYEYMEKGPLRNYLYGSSAAADVPFLSWKQRLQICIGAARGIHYLHTGYSHNIIHRDLKSSNILLGEDYLAKVADFGLSRMGPSVGETHVSTKVKGTFGYFDPEYFKVQKLTDKSDVYSFGVMLFEVLCGRPVIDPKLAREQLNLAEWALIWERKGELEKIVDPRLKGEINANSLRKFGEIAAKCLEEYGVDRPAIGDVLWNLEYALQLQETEVRREAFEDSGNVESQFPVMRRLPSSSIAIGDDEEEQREPGLTRVRSGVSESAVFSLLTIDDGR